MEIVARRSLTVRVCGCLPWGTAAGHSTEAVVEPKGGDGPVKVVTVIGARPQFIKAAAVSPLLRQVATEVIVHTGQHYDFNMSDVFFEELGLPKPDYGLGIGSGSHGFQTGRMLEAVEEVLTAEKPDWVLVYGDTNSTLAGALAAVKLHIPVAHVEAGLRAFNRRMPEEINRVLTDHASDLLFPPTTAAMENLAREGLSNRAMLVGDVMADILFRVQSEVKGAQDLLEQWGVQPGKYTLLTLHRPANVDNPDRLRRILLALSGLDEPVLFPVHPRTRERIREYGLGQKVEARPFVCVIPFGYREMLVAEANARVIVTDSGGVQKEAYLLCIPCITLRRETEWVETVTSGWNVLLGGTVERLPEEVKRVTVPCHHPPVFGDGRAAERIVNGLLSADELIKERCQI